MPAVSVIIVNWNGEQHLAECLTSLREQDFTDFEVIFVDNGSKDASLQHADELFPQMKIIALQTNTGFAKANNIGIQASSGQYVVLLNNDTRADRRFLSELVAAAEMNAGIGMVAPKILNYFESNQIDSIGGLLMCRDGIGQGRGRGELDRGQYDQLGDVFLPSGCAGLYRRAMLDEVGLLADEFFAYCEDSDLGLRCIWAGWRCVAAPRAVTYHKYSASSSEYSPLKLQLVERNHYFLAFRNFTFSQLLLLPLWTLYRYLLMAYSLLSGKGKGKGKAGARWRIWLLFCAFVKGHWQALLGAPRHWRQRPRIKRISNARFAQCLKEHRLAFDKAFLGE
ncbi:MAG: glycosyltransferase family 2 protein [Planctomycetota bacterium]